MGCEFKLFGVRLSVPIFRQSHFRISFILVHGINYIGLVKTTLPILMNTTLMLENNRMMKKLTTEHSKTMFIQSQMLLGRLF